MGRLSTLVVLAVVLAVASLTACEPPPPRLQLAVTTTATGADDVRGDGTCHSAAAGGCSLQAAIGEANLAAAGSDITIPPGDYADFSAVITGDVRLSASAPASTRLGDGYGVRLTVDSGGRLAMEDLNTGGGHLPWPFFVHVSGGGTLIAHRSALGSPPLGEHPWVPLRIEHGGVAVLSGSIVHSFEYESVASSGTLVAVDSSLLSSYNMSGLETSGPASTVLRGSAIARVKVYPGDGGECHGISPISLGYVHIEEPCGSVPTPTDGEGNAQYHLSATSEPYLLASSPLIDAIPVSDPACDTGSLDVYGNPRGVDGNGDGVPGCDIGAIEHLPASAD